MEAGECNIWWWVLEVVKEELEIWVHMCCSKFEEGDSQAQLYPSFWSSQESELCQEEGFQFSKVRISTKLTHPTCKTWIPPHMLSIFCQLSHTTNKSSPTLKAICLRKKYYDWPPYVRHSSLHSFGWPNKYLGSFCLLLPNFCCQPFQLMWNCN